MLQCRQKKNFFFNFRVDPPNLAIDDGLGVGGDRVDGADGRADDVVTYADPPDMSRLAGFFFFFFLTYR